MPLNSPRWLDVVRLRRRTPYEPYLLVLQHHAVQAPTRLVAPVSLPVPADMDLLAPPIMIDAVLHRVRILDMQAVPTRVLGETVASAASEIDAIMTAIDVVLRGYPVGLPH